MRGFRGSWRLPAAVLAMLIAGGAITGVTLASGLGRHPARPHYRGLSKARLTHAKRASMRRVIVVLRNQHRALPATVHGVASRVRAERAEQRPLVAQVARSGGRVSHQYRVLNAFAARASSTEVNRLRANRAVAKVVPDVVLQLPKQAVTGPAKAAAGGSLGSATGLCPSDPSKPILEPEALQTTHTAFEDPSTPQAQNLASGAGVKVAFFADGLDINDPDFVRPDGSKVFIDYKDFSGDGPNGPTGAAEAFGDASSIAAQGRQVYDISTFANPAHPLPKGCNITIRGMAPGASLIGMKVFGNSSQAFDSTVLQGLDWAVSQDHADILSESFGEYPIPDTAQDLTRQFNEQAVAAGITVVESTGDSGVESSVSSATSDPDVIAAGASTTFRSYAQLTQYGFQFATGSWLNDNISSIESAGPTQDGRVLDLVAPGEANWALCNHDLTIYEECADFKGDGADIEQFGGTSESAPLIAGAAALVVQAYRETHGQHTPSPALVRQLLTSTATDLGFPSVEQGAGEVNSLGAVQAAMSVSNSQGAGTPTGNNLLTSVGQIDLSGQAGSTPNVGAVKVTNVGTSTQIVHARTRQVGTAMSNQTGTVQLGSSSPTFVDQFGASRPYREVHFNVPSGADRLVAFLAWPGPQARVGVSLIDPNGNFAAFTRPQGNGNHGEVDVKQPVAGSWTAIIFQRDGTFSGPVHWQFTSQKYDSGATVTPSALTLAPGQTGSFKVSPTLPHSAGDSNQDLVFSSSSGQQSVVPIELRSLVNIGSNGGNFSGTLIGGNGRAFSPGQLNTFDFQVPAGKPELGVTLTFSDDKDTQINGFLIDPHGQALAAESTARVNAAGNVDNTKALQVFHLNPQAGRWRFVMDVTNPVGGNALSAPFSGHVTFSAPSVNTGGLPNSASTTLPAGKAAKFTLKVTNNGPASEDLFLDPRRPGRQNFPLLSVTPASNLTLPLSADNVPPIFLMPSQTNQALAAAQGTAPVTFDWGFGDPHLVASSSGNTASGTFAAPELSPGEWFIAPDLIGPFAGPVAPQKVSVGMLVRTRGFDLDASPATGDIWENTVDPNADGFNPVTVKPGKTGNLKVTITPSGRSGRVVRGTLFVDNFSSFVTFGNELLAIPYEYSVG
jgi:hypothetical protein